MVYVPRLTPRGAPQAASADGREVVVTTKMSTRTGVSQLPADIGAWSAPRRSSLFGPLGSTDVSSAVVGWLRAAIGLGLFPDGERLPKEAHLAVQLGVTSFALREALATLRAQGLVVTRAGKYGGSFVTYPPESEQLEHDELADLSSAELRDLGDWRQMLATNAASLAALRASESNIAMLTTYAGRVREAQSSVEARRAHGRFFLELSSAAQSMRLTSAQFAAHEQIDWLFGLALQTPDERAVASAGLDSIAVAVRERSSTRARDAAAEHIERMIGCLGVHHLEGIAARQRLHPTPMTGTLATGIAKVVDLLTDEMARFADDVAPAMSSGEAFAQVRSRISLPGLQRFQTMPTYVKGIGILAEVGAIAERPYWIEWWRRTDVGLVADNHHVTDPAREYFYDYGDMEFIARPRETHEPWAFGPYVDYGGEDDYILTLASPILANGDFYGISAVDVPVGELESWLSPQLASAKESYLLNSENRVIVSNSLAFTVGDVMSNRDGFRVIEFPSFGWSLVTQDDPT